MEEAIKGFDYRSTIRDPKTGKVIESRPFKIFAEGGLKWIEKDGKCFAENGVEIKDPRTERQIVEKKVEARSHKD